MTVVPGQLLRSSRVPTTAEDPILAWPASSFPVLGIRAPGGAGKSTLTDHLAGKWEAAGHAVVLLRATHTESPSLWEALCESLRLADTVTVAEFCAQMPARESGLIVVVDGLNEHPQADQFLQSIYAICREAGAESPMKVLFTFRSGNEQWFSPSEEDQALMMPPPARDDASRSMEAGEKPLHTIGPLNLQETEAMWKEYAQEAPERFCPAFTFAEAMESSRRFCEVLRNPMLLRIFLANHGRGQPERLTQCSLFGAYFDRLAEKTADDGQLLANIARLAVEQDTGKV